MTLWFLDTIILIKYKEREAFILDFLEHIEKIDEMVQKNKKDEEISSLFGTQKESADELYVKSCGIGE